MKKTWILLLILCGFAMAQRPYNNQRSGYAQNILWRDLHPSTQDSIRKAVADSLAALSADGVSITNTGGTFSFKNSYLATAARVSQSAVYVTEFGAKSGDAIDDATAFQNAINAAVAVGLDTGYVVIPPGDGRYLLNSDITIQNVTGSRPLKIYGNGAVIKVADGVTGFKTAGLQRTLTFDGLTFHGSKAGNTQGIWLGADSVTVSSVEVRECDFDSLTIGLRLFDVTSILVESSDFKRSNIGVFTEYNSDGHTYENCTWGKNDTSFVADSSSNDMITFINPVIGSDSVFVVLRGGGSINIKSGYAEGVRHLGIIGAAGQAGFRTLILDGFVDQGTVESGWNVYGSPNVVMFGCRSTGGSFTDNVYMFLETTSARFIGYANYIGDSLLYVNDGYKYALSESFEIGTQKNFVFNANAMPSTDKFNNPIIHNRIYNNSVNKSVYYWIWENASSNSAAYIWRAWGGDYNNQVAQIGITAGYWQLGSSGLTKRTLADSLRGDLFVQQTYPTDKPFVALKDVEASTVKWYDLIAGKFESDPLRFGRDAFTTTALHDTVLILGLKPTLDFFSLIPKTASPDSSAFLTYTSNTDTLFVHRYASTISGLQYEWQRHREYAYSPATTFNLYSNFIDQKDQGLASTSLALNYGSSATTGTITNIGSTAAFTDSGLTLTGSSSQYITYGNNFDITTEDFALFAVAKQNSAGTSQAWIGKRHSSGDWYRLYVNSAGQVAAETNGNTLAQSGDNTGNFDVLVMTRTSGEIKLYSNKLLVDSVTVAGSLTNAGDFQIGRVLTTGYMTGVFAAGGVRIGTAMGQEEVNALYNYFKNNYAELRLQ